MNIQDPRPTAYPDFYDMDPDWQLAEIRKGELSEHYDEFKDDPCVLVECLWCGLPFTITAESTACDNCRWDYDTPRRWEPDCISDLEAA